MATKSAAAVRLAVESALAGRVIAPFQYHERRVLETASTGVATVDALTGGLPRGGLTEIFGPAGSGKMSLLVSALAARTQAAEVCALVDARDAFDPETAAAAGVRLERLLWVRCREIAQAMRVTDLLLQGGGFGMVTVDLSDIAPRLVRHVPLNVWFRWRRAVENTRTILLVIGQESHAKTCASLVVRLQCEATQWASAVENTQQTEAHLLDRRKSTVEKIREKKQTQGVLMMLSDAAADFVSMETRSAGKYGTGFAKPLVKSCKG